MTRERPRIVVVGWRCEGWVESLKPELNRRYRTSAAITSLDLHVGPALGRALTFFLADRGCRCWLVVRCDQESLYGLCWWMQARRIDWSELSLAMVDVRWTEIESVVEAVRSLPRWPSLWLPPRDGSEGGRLKRAEG